MKRHDVMNRIRFEKNVQLNYKPDMTNTREDRITAR